MRIVWLCNFVNQELKEYFKTPQLNEFAPWINILIELFKDQKDIELHIVAPNVFTNTDCSFSKDGINYHFYKRIPIPYNNKYIRKIHTLLHIEKLSDFFWVKHKIVNCITKINPDLIHLHGAENPYYSAGILPLFGRYHILTTIQGFIRNTSDSSSNSKRAIKIEEIILKKSKHIGIRTDDMREIALTINPEATLHFHFYPLAVPSTVKNNIGNTEPVDCLFFANVTKDKGIEDLLEAISIVKKDYPEISLSVIGSTIDKYLIYLKKVCSELNIEQNVKFLGFMPTQNEIFKYALQAKMYVIPTYHDIMPGSIIESMLMKLPVIAYAVGGIPELNKDEINIILVERRNISQLAEKILQLLNNEELRLSLSQKAYILACSRINNNKVIADILNAYNFILNEDVIS